MKPPPPPPTDSDHELTADPTSSSTTASPLAADRAHSRTSTHDRHGHGQHHDAEHQPHRKPSSVIKRMTTGLFTPERKIRKSPGWRLSFVNLAKSSWINLLLVFIPVSSVASRFEISSDVLG